jgi:lysophospholipase L1-like esterase
MVRAVVRLGIAVGVFGSLFFVADALVVPRLIDSNRPAAYARSDYWGADFKAEATVVADLRTTRETSVGTVQMSSDFKGRYISVEGGLRRTVPVPASAQQRVVAFGGSTTFCVEVPDALTWPSQLARRVVDREIQVVNVGLSGASFADRVSALEGLGLTSSGDVAVFLVGGNDAVIGQQENEVVGPLARWPRLRRVIEMSLGWSNVGRFALERSQQLRFTVTGNTAEAVETFRESLNRVNRAAQALGVRVLVVLQASEIIDVRSGWVMTAADLDADYVRSFREFYERVRIDPELRNRIVDGTAMFDPLRISPYLDFLHVQEDGNKAIANFVYAELDRRGWLD